MMMPSASVMVNCRRMIGMRQYQLLDRYRVVKVIICADENLMCVVVIASLSDRSTLETLILFYGLAIVRQQTSFLAAHLYCLDHSLAAAVVWYNHSVVAQEVLQKQELRGHEDTALRKKALDSKEIASFVQDVSSSMIPPQSIAEATDYHICVQFSMATPPFHKLLAFYSNRSNEPDTQTIRLVDSLRGNLSLGLDFPVALAVAVGRHLWLRNTSLFSFNIHVPSVSVRETLLEGVPIDEKKQYTRAEIVAASAQNGLVGQADAFGLWSLASDVNTGLIKGEDVVAFQKGTLLQKIEERRKDRSQVLPLWRGGPISVAGHSWLVGSMFGVQVYRTDLKND
ncbi:hypothetical protein MRB53_037241 [Persea americana]|nr:hypothetical protein MRB53_037241 [Persea americana]